MATTQINKNLAAMLEFEKAHQCELDFGVVVTAAFIRGIREIGYKHTGTALDELVDNSVQADAENIHVVFGYGPKSDAKPNAIAVLDDGHGMDAVMTRYSVRWGGTHREDDREGMGRFGYGLPSACVSQGKTFAVYSRTATGPFNWVEIDSVKIGKGEYSHEGQTVIPEAVPARLPEWVRAYGRKHFGDNLERLRTVVLITELDKPTWKTARALEVHLLKHFGLTYRNYLRSTNILVNSTTVLPVDPLFLTPGAMYYDLDEDRAVALEPLTFDVKDPERREVAGTIKVRFTYTPPTFQRAEKDKARGRQNKRFEVMKENNGIIVLRQGRQIDVVTRCPWTVFTNNDRNWGVEVDFTARLDEEFSITTSKQQVAVSDRIWKLLYEHGVWNAIKEMRRRYRVAVAEQTTRLITGKGTKRASEHAMETSERFKTRRAAETEEKAKRRTGALEQEVQRRVKESGVAPELIRERLEAEVREKRYKVEEESMPGAPFFRVEQRGGQKVLLLNVGHRFYTDVYAAQDTSPRIQSALETMLFVIGDSELDATGERELFYKSERAHWSMELEVALAQLDNWVPAEEEEDEDFTQEEDEALLTTLS